MNEAKPVLQGVLGSVVLVAQIGMPGKAAAEIATFQLSADKPSYLREKDLVELEIRAENDEMLADLMREWSSKAFLSLVPAISDAGKMRVALLKMHTIVDQGFHTEDLARLTSEQQKLVYAVFYQELENYSERVTLLTQLIRNCEDDSIRDLAETVFAKLAKGAPAPSRLNDYLRKRAAHEVDALIRKDRELAEHLGMAPKPVSFARK